MAKFVFHLQAVLSHRQRLEREKQRELALAQGERAAIQEQIRRLDEMVHQATEDLRRNHLTGALDLPFLAAHRRFMMSTQRRALELMQKLQKAQEKVETARGALAEAAKQRKILEKLHERQHARWADEIVRKEMGQLDEVSTQMSYQAALERENGV